MSANLEKMSGLFVLPLLLLLAPSGLASKCNWDAASHTTNCSGLGLTAVPDNLNATTETLDLSHNLLTDVAAEPLSRLTRLRTLLLSDNNLVKVPDLTLPSLASLDLAGNQLKVNGMYLFGSTWAASRNLRAVDLSRNLLEHLPSTALNNLDSAPLANLSLAANKFVSSRIPVDPGTLKPVAATLAWLDLGANGLSADKVMMVLRPLRSHSSLRWLNLSGNSLPRLLSNLLASVRGIKSLALAGSGVVGWERTTFAGVALTELDLSDNALVWLAPGADAELGDLAKSLRHLRLGGNPFVCNCSLAWLREWMDGPGHGVVDDEAQMKCAQPSEMKGQSASNFSVSACTKNQTTTTPAPTNITTTPATNITTPAPTTDNVTTEEPDNNSTTVEPNPDDGNATTAAPYTDRPGPTPLTTASPGSKGGFPWWGIVLLLALFACVFGVAFYVYRSWRRRRMMDEGRLPIISDETA